MLLVHQHHHSFTISTPSAPELGTSDALEKTQDRVLVPTAAKLAAVENESMMVTVGEFVFDDIFE